MDINAANAYIEDSWQAHILPTLYDYIRIPNKSPVFDGNWHANGHMHAAARLLLEWVQAQPVQGMSAKLVELPGRTPTILVEVAAHKCAHAESVLLYGHYDKQPEFDGWHEDLSPWTPVEREGKLYGRGGADDGYALFASLNAIALLQHQNLPHPRCVLLIEGCEESGSFDLPYYVDHLAEEIGSPKLVVCLDAECGNYDQLWVTNSLRGMLPGTLTIKILEEGQHSGAAGGIVPSSFRILRHLLDRVESAVDGTLHDCLCVPIPDGVREAAQEVAQVLGPSIVDKFPWVKGAHPDTDDIAELVVRNSWHPALATVGLDGAPSIANAGNTLRPLTQAKLVFRLPPTLDAERAAQDIKHVLETDPPYGAKVSFELDTPQTGWCAPPLAPWLEQRLREASQQFFSQPPMQMGMGGTIPFMKMLGDAFPLTQFLVTGVLGPQSNAHGPNEFLHIATAKRLTGIVAYLLTHT